MNVVIGIQARSTSTRFPGKCFAKIDGKDVLEHVIDNCQKSAQYINRFSIKNKIQVSVVVLIPFNDEIKNHYRYKTIIFEGPEHDVLNRYRSMQDSLNPDYVVRVTADCPLLPSHLITKHIHVAVNEKLDYCSNVDEELRTAPDGYDVEVISKRALLWADLNAKQDYEREHVTLILRNKCPIDFKVGHVVSHLDLSHLKLSLDRPEELETINTEYLKIKNALNKAGRKSGAKSIHRI